MTSQAEELAEQVAEDESAHWVDKVDGTFGDSASYDEAMKLGQEYRGGEL